MQLQCFISIRGKMVSLLKKSHGAGKFSMHCLHFVFVLNDNLNHH